MGTTSVRAVAFFSFLVLSLPWLSRHVRWQSGSLVLTCQPLLLATMGNSTLNSRWPTCVGCAILHRSFSKTGTAIPDVCDACFREFCWDGSFASEGATYNPELKLGAKEMGSETSGVAAWRGDWGKVLAVVLAAILVVGA